MEYSSKSSMTKVDRSKKTCFEICGILKESKTNSKNNISLCSFLFLTNSKGILYKALRPVNGCSVKRYHINVNKDFIEKRSTQKVHVSKGSSD